MKVCILNTVVQKNKDALRTQSIFLICADEDGKRYCIEIVDYIPYVYLQCADESNMPFDVFYENIKMCGIQSGVPKMEIVYKKSLNGYRDRNKPTVMARCFSSQNLEGFVNYIKFVHAVQGNYSFICDIFEDNNSTGDKFVLDTDLKAGVWIEIDNYSTQCPVSLFFDYYKRQSVGQISELKIVTDEEYKNKLPPITVVYWDIETTKKYENEVVMEWTPEMLLKTNVNPYEAAFLETDNIVCISAIFKQYFGDVRKGEKIEGYVFRYKGGAYKKKEYEAVMCKDEPSMILEFMQMVKKKADILSGWNIDKFDIPKVEQRLHFFKINESFSRFHKGMHFDPMFRVVNKESGMQGPGYAMQMDDMIVLDGYRMWLTMIEASYKLDSIAKKYLGEQKAKVPYSFITKLMQNLKDMADEWAKLDHYNYKDSLLVLKLFDTKGFIGNTFALAKLNAVVPMSIWYTGLQYQLTQFMLWGIRHFKLDFIFPTPKRGDEVSKDKYPGGQVFNPRRLGVIKCPVTIDDFNSLYPSEEIFNNLCFSSSIKKEDMDKYAGRPGVYRYVVSNQDLIADQGKTSKQKNSAVEVSENPDDGNPEESEKLAMIEKLEKSDDTVDHTDVPTDVRTVAPIAGETGAKTVVPIAGDNKKRTMPQNQKKPAKKKKHRKGWVDMSNQPVLQGHQRMLTTVDPKKDVLKMIKKKDDIDWSKNKLPVFEYGVTEVFENQIEVATYFVHGATTLIPLMAKMLLDERKLVKKQLKEEIKARDKIIVEIVKELKLDISKDLIPDARYAAWKKYYTENIDHFNSLPVDSSLFKLILAYKISDSKCVQLNARQEALKLDANGMYGYTGAKRGRCPAVEVGATVTSTGRETITFCKEVFENCVKVTIDVGKKSFDLKISMDKDLGGNILDTFEKYRENGGATKRDVRKKRPVPPRDTTNTCLVHYGDTDSLMIEWTPEMYDDGWLLVDVQDYSVFNIDYIIQYCNAVVCDHISKKRFTKRPGVMCFATENYCPGLYLQLSKKAYLCMKVAHKDLDVLETMAKPPVDPVTKLPTGAVAPIWEGVKRSDLTLLSKGNPMIRRETMGIVKEIIGPLFKNIFTYPNSPKPYKLFLQDLKAKMIEFKFLRFRIMDVACSTKIKNNPQSYKKPIPPHICAWKKLEGTNIERPEQGARITYVFAVLEEEKHEKVTDYPLEIQHFIQLLKNERKVKLHTNQYVNAKFKQKIKIVTIPLESKRNKETIGLNKGIDIQIQRAMATELDDAQIQCTLKYHRNCAAEYKKTCEACISNEGNPIRDIEDCQNFSCDTWMNREWSKSLIPIFEKNNRQLIENIIN